jgi:hypothetical protein
MTLMAKRFVGGVLAPPALWGFPRGLVLTLVTITGLSGPLQADDNAGKVRIVNLYRGLDGKPVAVDVYLAGTTPTTPTVTLAFGQASDYLTVPTPPPHLLFYPAGQRTGKSRLADLNLQEQAGPGTPVSANGEQVTVLVAPGTTESPVTSIGVVREWSRSRFALYAPRRGIAMVVGWAGGVRSYGQQLPAFRLGVPGKGCLKPLMQDTVTATYFSPFEAPKGPQAYAQVPLAAYAATDERCAGPPLAGPRKVPTFVEGRTFVFVHGADPAHIDILALPIPYPEE